MKSQELTEPMQAEKAHIDDLHFEHESWMRELVFFKVEMIFFKQRLEEIASKYTSSEVLMDLEKFQNQLYIQGIAMDELMHDVQEKEHDLAAYAAENPVAINRVLFDDHARLRDRIDRNREIVEDFKRDFQRFLAKWM